MYHFISIALFVANSPIALASSVLHSPAQIASWETLAPISLFARQEHTAVFLPPSTIAILGGVIPANTSDPPVDTTSLMQFYFIHNNTWLTKASVPRALNHLNSAVVNGKIYVLGGLADAGEKLRKWRAVPDSWVYSPSTDSWDKLPGLPIREARGSAAVGVYDNKIYLAGGLIDTELFPNGKEHAVPIVSIFDTITATWLPVPKSTQNIPESRDHAGAAVVGSKMYILGGRNGGQLHIRDTVFVLDLCNLKVGWRTSSAKMPTPRGGVAAGAVGTKIFIFGGEGNTAAKSGVFDQVEAYDTRRDVWESFGRMRLPRHGTYAVGIGKRVYVPGGGVMQGGAPVMNFDVFTPYKAKT
ncbi:galactose oxidase [Cucurbitaria berberidis CBS 394.84]|uniref:Galactose oxidase n=1 Tax=Cucurbitaria berberidis CBS 394.84 TaxID=1168544 RepID=A0A9P4GQQ7_9PLEO|nr:galactose oxidase [Cucurbitaria berberidis CBS 394.84]KAF1849565.1 galactose oxidase [Cucurbitaria berberidis CBS 394.84]